ncbi:dihydroxyacetone kinase subunit DhaL [Streptomyces sp. 3N207]|uniref:dihydroxyacetone kinase subunit DhaL n=1 Tax=Streptomyces sp. 3N207 TaxID=3457417 RepID=UPI003FD060D9
MSGKVTNDAGGSGDGGGGSEGVQELDAAFFARWMTAAADAVAREADRLTELDSAIGDADHGGNMRRGFEAVREELGEEVPPTPGAVLMTAGRKLVSTVGGASGPLYGTLLRRAGKVFGSAEQVSREELATALRTGIEAVAQLGGAVAGDKTMLDALFPAVEALADSGGKDFEAARTAAEQGAEETVPLQARKGRASYLGERSIGHQDPGATSAALLVAALAEADAAQDAEGDAEGAGSGESDSGGSE